MKKVLVLMIVAIALSLAGAHANAQKFGHIDMMQLIQVMPERATAETELQKSAGELEDMLMNMQTELQEMYKDYQENIETMSDLIRQAKEEDIQAKTQRIETFRVQADQQLQQKRQELMKPIYDKMDEAIAVVAKEQGLLYVFDLSSRVVLYKSHESVDILPLVKKQLGIE